MCWGCLIDQNHDACVDFHYTQADFDLSLTIPYPIPYQPCIYQLCLYSLLSSLTSSGSHLHQTLYYPPPFSHLSIYPYPYSPCIGTFFNNNGSFHFGNYPLLFAVCCGDTDVFDLVLSYASSVDPEVDQGK